ncbi:MAG: energy-coupling factor transporter ATPase [Clostridia bacterium]|nr:energy-coupling factor transporter ATPase [Clostridia bacterium]
MTEIYEEAVKFENVRFSYEGKGDGVSATEETESDGFFDGEGFALRGVSLSVKKGEFVALLGHNGSGKSTLARLINGLLFPTSGKITVLGREVTDDKNIFEIRRRVGLVFQNPDNQTVASIVEDDIAFGPENVGVPRKEIGERIEFALNAVGMSKFRYATPARLSGGQKQRIAIAGVLALKPEIMILDESTAMLDPRGRREVVEVVKRLNEEEGITVLLITHFPEEALLADRAIVMNKGEVVMEGRPEEILGRSEDLRSFRLLPPRPLRICEQLRAGGLEIADCFGAETLATEIASALSHAAEKPQEVGAGVRLSENETEQNDTVTGDLGEILCENLSYVYNPNSPFSTHALSGVDLNVGAGEFFGIIGHTGSGKSTFVQHLNALIKLPTAQKKYKAKKPKKGEAPLPATRLTVGGFDLTDKTTDFKALRSKVGMVFQYPEYQLFAETVFDDVAFGLKNFAKEPLTDEQTAEAVKEALSTVGLDYAEVKNRSPFELSGGQRRRVAIAGVIVTKPEILVLDEPAAGLDPLGKEEIMKLLHKIHKDWCKTVIIVSHDMDEIAENCTRAAVFSAGKVVRACSPKALFSAPEQLISLGLDIPFTAKVTEELEKRGVKAQSDFTSGDFVRSVLALFGELPAGGEASHA